MLPAAVSSHHTVWVTPPGGKPRPVRYAVDGGRLICFGDDSLVAVSDGTRVSLAVHKIAGGPELARFGATLQGLAPDAIGTNALLELLGHVPLGRTTEEVAARLEEHRSHRRVVELVP